MDRLIAVNGAGGNGVIEHGSRGILEEIRAAGGL
jgi:hypothetical protein